MSTIQSHPAGSARAKPNGAPVARRQPVPAQQLAPLAAVEVQPADEPMWPGHPAGWFHPEFRPLLPESSGAAIESGGRPALAEVYPLEIGPADQSHCLVHHAWDPLLAAEKPRLPPGALEPFGWDPRAVAPVRTEGGNG